MGNPLRLIDFPVDILRLIFELMVRDGDISTLRTLRLAHSALNGVVTPILFREIKLSVQYITNEGKTYAFYPNKWVGKDALHLLEPSQRKRRAWESRQDFELLFENVQDIHVKHYDLYRGYPNVKEMFKSWPMYSESSAQMLQEFLGGMKKLRILR
ncbi:hypothetical protein ABW20_dc0104205 [Dactylellina cionopaga]|nr:hypothetical protein ABW20_dc0104205 [Dactylellina cionopaga]